MTTVSPALGLQARRTLSYIQVDGIFSLAAKSAAGQFQRDSGLAADGVAGPAAWASNLGWPGRRWRIAADADRWIA